VCIWYLEESIPLQPYIRKLACNLFRSKGWEKVSEAMQCGESKKVHMLECQTGLQKCVKIKLF